MIPRFPLTFALARELGAAVGTVLLPPVRSSRRSGCRWGRVRGSPARIGKSSVIPDQLLSRIRDVRAQCGQEVERRKDSGRRVLGIAAAASAAVVDDLAGFRAVAQAFEGDRRMNHVACHTPPGLAIVGSDRLAQIHVLDVLAIETS